MVLRTLLSQPHFAKVLWPGAGSVPKLGADLQDIPSALDRLLELLRREVARLLLERSRVGLFFDF